MFYELAVLVGEGSKIWGGDGVDWEQLEGT